ncbi:MAG: hypothetical protein WA369_10430 [Candidatus Acidiferrales bacterium]
MNMLAYPDKERPWLRRLAGAGATLSVDVALWILAIFLAVSGGPAFFVVAVTVGFLAVGVFFGLYAKKQKDRPFLQGVIIATSLVLLLDVACASWLGRS